LRDPLDHGGSVLIETDEPSTGPGRRVRGLGKDRSTLAEKADKTFEDATAAVTPAAGNLIARLRSLDDPPDEVASSSACSSVRIPELHRIRCRGS
jgi:Trypsin-co-occurring domain 1